MVVGALLPLLLALQGSRIRNTLGRKRDERALRGGVAVESFGLLFSLFFSFLLGEPKLEKETSDPLQRGRREPLRSFSFNRMQSLFGR